MARHQGKRTWHRAQEDRREEPEADDLQIAAAFAQQTAVSAMKQMEEELSGDKHDNGEELKACGPSHQTEEDPLVQGDEEDASDVESDAREDDRMRFKDVEESDDDCVSDVDLSEALARMQDASDDEDGDVMSKSKKESSAVLPKTEHEVDPYHVPLAELESKFQMNLTVEEQDRLRIMSSHKSGNANTNDSAQLVEAGYVKSHMVSMRTLVVESGSPGTSPLDEGSLLVIRVDDDTDESPQHRRLVPLGKVLEVFGPVSRPLYAIRLPSAPVKREANVSNVTNNAESDARTDPQDNDEIPLSDSETTAEEAGDRSTVAGIADMPGPESSTSRSSDGSSEPPILFEDPWAENGANSLLIKSTPNIPVYYIPDITNVLDTGLIMRNSRRGCDASNVYDEEVVNANEMEFSDDEKEREFKNRRKNKGGDKKRNDRKHGHKGFGSRPKGPERPRYSGFHDGQRPHQPVLARQQAAPPPPQYGYSQQPYPPAMQQAHSYNFPQMPGPAAPYGYPASSPYPTSQSQQFPAPSMGAGPYYCPPQHSYPPQPPQNEQSPAGRDHLYHHQPQQGNPKSGDVVYYDYS